MPLKSSGEIAVNQDAHGIQPAEYVVQMSRAGQPFDALQLDNDHRLLVAMYDVELGYGSKVGQARMVFWDADTVELPEASGSDINNRIWTPRNGDRVRVWYDAAPVGTSRQLQVCFQGNIVSVNQSTNEQGRQYVVTARSEVARLDEYHVTFSCNEDPRVMSGNGNFFGANGEVVASRLKTLAEILRDILSYQDAWGTTEFFAYEDVYWPNEAGVSMEFSPRLGMATPMNVSFRGATKGEAIERLLQSVGNFTFHYDPNADPGDPSYGRLVIVELNLSCNRCGDLWDISFPEPISQSLTANYAYEHDIKEDSTEWSSVQSANVCRITGARINFYTGSYLVPDRVRSSPTTLDENCVPYENDTVVSQKQRAIGHDGAFYRFRTNMGKLNDARQILRYPVGIPLFPDWNPHEDYLPVATSCDRVQVPAEGFVDSTGTPIQGPDGDPLAPKHYADQIEFLGMTNGYECAAGQRDPERTNNLRSYQAWGINGLCRGCHGSGYVQKVYSGPVNEPVIQLVPSPSGLVVRHQLVVTNYIFDPARFGEDASDPLYNPGVTPYIPATEGDYAEPWKHLCPVCRGVGHQPAYKIRNIQRDLVQGRALYNANPLKSDKVTPYSDEIPIDTQWSALEIEGYHGAQDRIAMNEGPQVQLEAAIVGNTQPLPTWSYRNSPFAPVFNSSGGLVEPGLDAAPGEGGIPTDQKIKFFGHPLDFQNLKKRLIGMVGISPDSEDAKILKPIGKALVTEAPFTKILPQPPVSPNINLTLGKVQFPQPVFIPCRHEFSAGKRTSDGKWLLKRNGLLSDTPAAGGYETQTREGQWMGYWRPARAWLQCFYNRVGYFHRFDTPPVTVWANDPEGVLSEYLAKPMIIDGRYTLEVVKVNPDDWSDSATEVGNYDRVRQRTFEDNSMQLEVTPDDLEAVPLPVPNGVSIDMLDDDNFEELKRTYFDLDFPRATMFKYMAFSPSELPMNGYVNIPGVKENGNLLPRFFSWRLQDDRLRMLVRAIRTLEATNNLQVIGRLNIRGRRQNMEWGLGWVDYPDRGRAAVVRVTLDFREGFIQQLELSRQEARYGEIPPDERGKIDAALADLNDLRRDNDKARRNFYFIPTLGSSGSTHSNLPQL